MTKKISNFALQSRALESRIDFEPSLQFLNINQSSLAIESVIVKLRISIMFVNLLTAV